MLSVPILDNPAWSTVHQLNFADPCEDFVAPVAHALVRAASTLVSTPVGRISHCLRLRRHVGRAILPAAVFSRLPAHGNTACFPTYSGSASGDSSRGTMPSASTSQSPVARYTCSAITSTGGGAGHLGNTCIGP